MSYEKRILKIAEEYVKSVSVEGFHDMSDLHRTIAGLMKSLGIKDKEKIALILQEIGATGNANKAFKEDLESLKGRISMLSKQIHYRKDIKGLKELKDSANAAAKDPKNNEKIDKFINTMLIVVTTY